MSFDDDAAAKARTANPHWSGESADPRTRTPSPETESTRSTRVSDPSISESARKLVDGTSELAERTQQLESFSYSVSHDLRAPLRAISGFAQILSKTQRHALDEQGRHLLANIVEASTQMGQLIDDLLAYSRVGRSAIHLVPVNLSDILRVVRRDLSFREQEVGARIEIAPDLPTVLGDPTLLSQIFTNLFDNAMTYCALDVRPDIVLDWRVDGEYTVLSVRDRGIGIEASQFGRIFEVFQRLHSQDEYPGTGVGLAVVAKAVQLQGGTVWVESIIGEGSVFHVRLKSATDTEYPVNPTNHAQLS
jgi:light-regulated signal transduction histidine kinase (bacteriophytochrome)